MELLANCLLAVSIPTVQPTHMNSDQKDRTMVGLDPCVTHGLDRWRQNCPTINRSALVNQILLEWLNEKDVWE